MADILPTKGIVNYYGDPCTGKTTFFETNVKHIKLDTEILRSKERMVDFMERMAYSPLNLVIDSYELVDGLQGLKELKNIKHAIYIISNSRISTTNFKIDSYVKHDYELALTEFSRYLGVSVDSIRGLDMNSLKTDKSTSFKSIRDCILCPKEYVKDLLSKKCRPVDLLNRLTSEHGHTFALMHENYIDYVSQVEPRITESFSDADLIDNVIYTDTSWMMIDYFNVSACLIPAAVIKETKSNGDLRPGSIWTKFSNTCMRENRLKRLKIHRDCIYLIIKYINIGKCEIFFDSYNLDSLNQLSLSEKIISKILTKMKKSLK
jgi:hypothetical protein